MALFWAPIVVTVRTLRGPIRRPLRGHPLRLKITLFSELNTTGLKWCMVNLVQLRKLLRELILVMGFKAEIYENISNKWEKIFGSPGNLASIGNLIKIKN